MEKEKIEPDFRFITYCYNLAFLSFSLVLKIKKKIKVGMYNIIFRLIFNFLY